MVSFRRIILAIAVLALFTGLASAQVNIGGSAAGSLACTANVANPAQVRTEGYAELLGDISIICTGGTVTPGQVPLANITVSLNNTLVTSRVFDSTGRSEALLLIDEPGTSPTIPSVGTTLPQTVCTSATLGASLGGCQVVLGTATNTAGTATAAVLASNNAVVPNVFQGLVRGNQVIFNGVPILAPVSAGFARVFRIVNIRGNAAQFAGQSGSFQGQIPILASIAVNTPNGFPLQNSLLTTAYLFNGLGTTAVRNAANTDPGSNITSLPQCGTAALTPGAVLRFPEGFAAAFKTRVTPTTTLSGAGTVASGAAGFVVGGGVLGPVGSQSLFQNTPGSFSPGSESGFILPVTGGTAGLADFGTRLKATFNNVPSGINIFVTTTNINPAGNTGVPANTPTNIPALGGSLNNVPVGNVNTLLAALVLSETATAGQGGFLPLASNTNNNSGLLTFGPLPVDATGTATAVWEILTANPNAFETAEFGIFYSYTGNPATNVPPTTPTGTVSMSFAPTFSTPTASGLIPRFTPPSTSTTFISVSLCQTTLLYPFVSSEPGFDTGIAVTNTTQDPFGTKTQSGTCTFNFFATSGTNPPPFTTPVIGPAATDPTLKTMYAQEVSTAPGVTAATGFRGYIIAVCNFQLAHGYALFSDTGIRNWATGYLALVLPTGGGDRNTGHLLQGPGTPGAVEGAGQ